MWIQKLQTDTWNCGVWAIWVTERWMQYWTEEDGKQPFDRWLKRRTCPVPDIQQLRQQYHDMISTALVVGSDGQSEMDKVDRIIAKMWADAARKTNQNNMKPHVTTADASMTPGTRTSPASTNGQLTKQEEKLRSRAVGIAKPAAKPPSSLTRRRQTVKHSIKPRCTLRTRRHESKGHQNTLKASSSMRESQERTSMENNGTNITKQENYATQKQQHTRTASKGTILQFMKPSSNKTKVIAPTRTNTAHTCAQNTKRKSYETELHLKQCSNKQQTTNAQEATGNRQKAEGIFSGRYEELRLMTWNVMGTTTILDELQALALESKPCIIILTETKLTELEQDRRMLNTCLPDYKLYHSRLKGQKTGKLRTGSAGVTIAVHTSLTTQNSVQLINLDHPAAKGHCKCLKIQPPGSEALTIWGVYVPYTDMHTRKQVYSLLQKEMQTQDRIALEAGKPRPYHILAGDMNAALYVDDRQTNAHPEDAMHRELMQTLKMHTTDKHQGMPRSRSYHRHGRNCKSSEDSRIDDIFISENLRCQSTCHHHSRYYRRLRPQPNPCDDPTEPREIHKTRT